MVGLLIESKATIPMILLAERKNNFICLRLDLLNRNPCYACLSKTFPRILIHRC